MAVPAVDSNNAIAARLDHLLRRARIVKPSTSIDPPLQVSELVPENEPLLGKIEGMKQLAVESAVRSLFYANLQASKIDEPAFVNIWNLFDIVQYCCDRNYCSPQVTLLLMEELLDGQSIEDCYKSFGFLESRREAIIAISSKNKDLVILRLCNELLRRVSRAEDPVFSGRVYIFMFQSFPPGDKSSVNLRGEFHVENVTTFEDFLKDSNTSQDTMQVEADVPEFFAKEQPNPDDKTGESKVAENRIDDEPAIMDIDTLYPVFWSLQHSFSNPPSLFEEDKFKHFQKSLEATLAKFKVVPKVIQSGDSDRKKGSKPRSDDNYDTFANTFNPKYLTSRDLFTLELSDLAFQRHILVQALILIDFLLTLTDKSKNRPLYQNAQKAMQYDFTLRDDDTAWASGIRTTIANYLQEGPDGKFYYRMVDTVLSRDKNWVRWKMENCQPFTRQRIPTKAFLEARSGAQKAVGLKRPSKPLGVGSALDFLRNTEAENGLAQLRKADRFNVPNAELYAKKVQMTDLDLELAGSEEAKRELEDKKSSYIWRGLRLASKQQLSLFDKIEPGKGLEPLHPAGSFPEETSSNTAPISSEGRDHGIEEQRADEQSQMTVDRVAE